MALYLTCSHGHLWKKPAENEDQRPAKACPICGATDVRQVHRGVHSATEIRLPADPNATLDFDGNALPVPEADRTVTLDAPATMRAGRLPDPPANPTSDKTVDLDAPETMRARRLPDPPPGTHVGGTRPPTQIATPSKMVDDWGDTIQNAPEDIHERATETGPAAAAFYDIHEMKTEAGTGGGVRIDEWDQTARLGDQGPPATARSVPKPPGRSVDDWGDTIKPADQTPAKQAPTAASKSVDEWGDTIRPEGRGTPLSEQPTQLNTPSPALTDDWGDTIAPKADAPSTRPPSGTQELDEWGDPIAPKPSSTPAKSAYKEVDEWGDTIAPGKLTKTGSRTHIDVGEKNVDEWGDTIKPGSDAAAGLGNTSSGTKQTDEWGDTIVPGSVAAEDLTNKSVPKSVDEWGDTIKPGSDAAEAIRPPSRGTVSWGGTPHKKADDLTQKSASGDLSKSLDPTMALTGEIPASRDTGSDTIAWQDPSQNEVTAELPAAGTGTPGDQNAQTMEWPTAKTGGFPAPDQGKTIPTQSSSAGGRTSPSAQMAFSVPSSPPRRDTGDGPRIAGYEILGELGRGGMGVVYKARQVGLNRVVALKMILAAGQVTQKDLERFRIEGEAVAQLDHPNVVKIYEIGEHDGLPFFSFEFVDGGNLAKKISTDPVKPREAAEIMLGLAEGMETAHRKNIIHRDLKPANVLLARDGTPKITDFGLAKKVDEDSGMTRAGTVLGTPSYMPPEQAEGKINELGPHSDIYSLGAILYDLVTGRPPFRGETLLDTLFLVKTAEPMPPARLQPRLPRDLETICLKCLEKEPSKRYATAGDLAEDLRRFVQGRSIKARPTPLWEKAWKYTKRKPADALAIALSVLVLVGIVGGGWTLGAMKAEEARKELERANTEAKLKEEAVASEKEAQRQRGIAEEKRKIAERNFQIARATVEDLTKLGRVELAAVVGTDAVRRNLLQRAIKFNQGFIEQKEDDPDIRFRAAQAATYNADLLDSLGQLKEAEASFQDGQAALQQLVQANPKNPNYLEALASNYTNHALLLQRISKRKDAAEKYEQARKLLEQSRELGAKPAETTLLLTQVLNNEGLLAQSAGQFERAAGVFAQASKNAAELHEQQPRNVDYLLELARAQRNLGNCQAALGKIQACEDSLNKAIDAYEQVINLDNTIGAYQEELGTAQLELGLKVRDLEPRLAAKCFRDAVSRFERLVKAFPKTLTYQESLAKALNSQGVLFQAQGKAAEAEKSYAKAAELQAALVKEQPNAPQYQLNLIKNLVNRARQANLRGQPKEATQLFEQAEKLVKDLVTRQPDVAEYELERSRIDNELGVLYALQGRLEDAAKRFRQARSNFQDLSDALPNVPEYRFGLAQSDRNLGYVLLQQAKRLDKLPEKEKDPRVTLQLLQEAEKSNRTAIALLEKTMQAAPDLPAEYGQELAQAYLGLGTIQAATGQAKAAILSYRKLLAIREAAVNRFPDNWTLWKELADAHTDLGRLLADAKTGNQPAEAAKVFEKGVELLRKAPPALPRTPEYYSVLATQTRNVANALSLVGARKTEEEKWLRATYQTLETGVKQHQNDANLKVQLAGELRDLGSFLITERPKEAEGIAILKRAIGELDQLVRANPKASQLQIKLCEWYQGLASSELNREDHAAVAKTIGEMLKHVQPGQAVLYTNAASYLVKCIELAQMDENLTPGQRKQLGDTYAEQATQILFQAMLDGYKDLKVLEANPAFETLRKRGSVGQLLAAYDLVKAKMRSLPLLEATRKQQPNIAKPALGLAQTEVELAEALQAGNRPKEAQKYTHAAVQVLHGLAPNMLNGEVKTSSPAEFAQAASILARCARQVNEDPGQAQSYLDQSLELLKAAANRGFKEREYLKRPEFQLLKDRPEFKKLLGGA